MTFCCWRVDETAALAGVAVLAVFFDPCLDVARVEEHPLADLDCQVAEKMDAMLDEAFEASGNVVSIR